jgi:hypothetical protein
MAPSSLVQQRTTTTFCRQVTCWEFSRTSSLPAKTKTRTTKLHESAAEPEVAQEIDIMAGHAVQNGLHASGTISTDHHGDSSSPNIDNNGYEQLTLDGEDVPRPTDKGGFSHTATSRAKIAAANKGNTPWNKGRERSPAVKARIAAGVRAKNRERFLIKLAAQGITEEDYDAQQLVADQKKETERKERRTEKGGYRPTEETRAKISNILKEKYANGTITRKPRDPATIRRGFTHSEETRQKISDSLRHRWASDPIYREKMTLAATNVNTNAQVREKISNSLKKKWQDPEFRAEMLDKIAARKPTTTGYTETRREAISKAMKLKWQDEEYRNKTLVGISKKQAELAKARPVRPKSATTRAKKKPLKGAASSKKEVVRLVQPLSAENTSPKTSEAKKKKKKNFRLLDAGEEREPTIVAVKALPKGTKRKKAVAKKIKKKEPDGSVNRLREERRDLFDLLYGDEDDDDKDDDDDDSINLDKENEEDDDENSTGTGFIDLDLGDEDLDSFDPYGLEDF